MSVQRIVSPLAVSLALLFSPSFTAPALAATPTLTPSSSTGNYTTSPGDYGAPAPVKVRAEPLAQAETVFEGLASVTTGSTVYLTVAGKGSTLHSNAATVEAFLHEQKVKLSKEDKVSAPLKSKLEDRQFLVVTRVTLKPVPKSLPVAFKKVASKTPVACETGATRVATVGKPGKKVEQWVEVYEDGAKTRVKKLGEKLVNTPVDEVVAPCAPKVKKVESLKKSSTPTSRKNANTAAPEASGSSPSGTTTNTETYTYTPSYETAVPEESSSAPSSTTTVAGGKAEWLTAAGIPQREWSAVDYIVRRESSWDYTAVNKSSGATGLCQALPGNKMRSAGADWRTNPVTQLKWCNSYALERYGSWGSAYSFWINNHWW